MKMRRAGSSGAQSVHRTLDMMDRLVLAPEGLTIRTLVEATGTSPSTAYRLIAALESRGYVYRLSGRLYAGPRVSHTSHDFEERIGATLSRTAQPIVHRLGESTQGTTAVSLHLGNSGYLLLLDGTFGPPFTAISRGEVFPTHKGAIGRVLLAFGKPALQEQVSEAHSGPSSPSHTLPTAQDLALNRRAGYTYSADQVQSGTMGFFAPILHGHRAVGSVGTILRLRQTTRPERECLSSLVRHAALEVAQAWRGIL